MGSIMIRYDREQNMLYISRCDYLYRHGNCDEEAYKDMGDGDICIPLPHHFNSYSNEHNRTDGDSLEIIVETLNMPWLYKNI